MQYGAKGQKNGPYMAQKRNRSKMTKSKKYQSKDIKSSFFERMELNLSINTFYMTYSKSVAKEKLD